MWAVCNHGLYRPLGHSTDIVNNTLMFITSLFLQGNKLNKYWNPWWKIEEEQKFHCRAEGGDLPLIQGLQSLTNYVIPLEQYKHDIKRFSESLGLTLSPWITAHKNRNNFHSRAREGFSQIQIFPDPSGNRQNMRPHLLYTLVSGFI